MNPLADAVEFANLILTTEDAVVGATPREVVWSHRNTTLYRYRSSEPSYAVPILLVFALINRPEIFDLRPGRSLVEYLLEEGFDVFLVDWGYPDEEDADTRLEDYVCDELHWAIRETLRASDADELSLMGWCMGATLCVMYCALERRSAVRNVVLLTMPVDGRCSTYADWVGELDAERLAEHWRVADGPGDRLRQQAAQAADQLLHDIPPDVAAGLRRHRPPRGLPADGQMGGRYPAVAGAGLG